MVVYFDGKLAARQVRPSSDHAVVNLACPPQSHSRGNLSKPHQTHIFINRFIDELGIVNDGNLRPRQSGAPASEQRKSPKRPPPGHCIILVDASVRARNGGSAVAVCRDEAGYYLGASALVIEGVTDPTSLQALACREALCLAEDLNIRSFVTASDCKQVVADIDQSARGRYGAIISEIKLKAATFQCIFTFEGRATNYEAHSLARFSLRRGPGRHLWLGQPHDLSCIPLSVD